MTQQELIAYNAKVNHQSNSGWTALMWASHNGKVEVIKVLLFHRADLEIQANEGRTALILAARYGKIVQFIVHCYL